MLVTKTLAGGGEAATSGLAEKIAVMFDFLLNAIPSWIAGFLVFLLSIVIAKIAKNSVENRISDQIDEEHQEVLVVSGRVTYVVVMTVGITASLKIAGIDLTTILAAMAFGVGFALRAFIANFFAGVYILVSRQFAIGDFIQVGAITGKVVEIQSRATILRTYDGYKVIVPNLDIFTKQVTSFTTNPLRRIKIPLYISYDTDIGYAMKIAMQVIKKHPSIIKKPKPTIVLMNYGDSTIDLMARFWVGSRDGWFKIRSDISRQLWEGFTKAGIVVPYNIMHLETNQDTATEYKEFEEIAKQRKEKMRLAKEARKAAMAQILSAATTNVAPQSQPAQTQTNAGVATLAPQAVAQIPPIEPPAAYIDYEEIDSNG